MPTASTTSGTPGERNPQTGNPGPTLWLPKGETVRFVLTSRDVIHSFWVVPFLMKQDVIPGHTNVFEVTPNKEGTFMGKCAELCGVDHSRMLFNVKVVSPERYQAAPEGPGEEGPDRIHPGGHRADGPRQERGDQEPVSILNEPQGAAAADDSYEDELPVRAQAARQSSSSSG